MGYYDFELPLTATYMTIHNKECTTDVDLVRRQPAGDTYIFLSFAN